MSSPNTKVAAAAKSGDLFVPRPLVPVTIGKATLQLYPVITSEMKPPERALAYQVNKTALSVPGIDRRAMLDTLGTQINLNATVDGTVGDWYRYFDRNWCNFAHLSILSFHNDAGTQVVDSVTAGDASILLPVQDGAVANCRRANIKFVRVQLNLDFLTLVTLRPPGNTILRTEYYIELPQDSCDLTNGNNQAYRLTTYLGPGDLRAIAAADFERDILAHTLQDGPVDLLSPTFNLTAARLDRTTLVSEIRNKIIMLATPSVLDCLFNQLCPGYSKEPHAALDHIRQTYDDAQGNVIFQPVFDYYRQILSASRPFIDQDPLPISICQIFIDGLDSRLIKGFRTHFPNYSTSQALAATHQRNTLEQMMQAAVKAESEYDNIRAIASEAVGGTPGQAFQAQVNASQAERTLTQYGTGGDDRSASTDGRRGRGPLRCFGCGGPHPYSLLEDGIYVIKCPNAADPKIRENAKATIDRIKNKRKKQSTGNKKRKNLATTNLADFDEESRKRITEQVYQAVTVSSGDSASVASTLTGVTGTGTSSYATGSGRGRGRGHVTFMYDVSVLTTCVSPTRPIIPVGIQSLMPHIPLLLGQSLDDPDIPVIRCMVDTGAALNTGNYSFIAAIAKRYPHCVAKVFLPEDHSPIILSGIIDDENEAITTELSVAFQFHLPYLTRDGQSTSISIATGPQVSVNSIIGLPFITGTGMIIVTVDNVVEAKHLVCQPFPIEFRCATKYVPAISDDRAETRYIEFNEVLSIIEKTDAYIAKVYAGTPSATNKKVRISEQHMPVGPESDSDSLTSISTNRSMIGRWLPPSSANDTPHDYHDNVLGENGYL